MAIKKIHLKYTFSCDPQDLLDALHKPEVMRNWLAEKVEFNPRTKVFTFHWSNFSETALIGGIDEKQKFIRWEWVGDNNERGEYVSFKLSDEDDEGYTDLYIEDFCEEEDEVLYRKGWDRMMERLNYACM